MKKHTKSPFGWPKNSLGTSGEAACGKTSVAAVMPESALTRRYRGSRKAPAYWLRPGLATAELPPGVPRRRQGAAALGAHRPAVRAFLNSRPQRRRQRANQPAAFAVNPR